MLDFLFFIYHYISPYVSGNLKLFDHILKSYHKYVRDTTQAQNQAQQILREKLIVDEAIKNRDEESILERTSLRARIRGLEAEIESMRVIQNRSNKENHYLRVIVDEYIRSSDANDQSKSVGDVVVDLKVSSKNKQSSVGDRIDPATITTSFCRKDTLIAGRSQLRAINQIESEMDTVCMVIAKEEDRQRLIIQDIIKLCQQNEHIFGHDPFSAKVATF